MSASTIHSMGNAYASNHLPILVSYLCPFKQVQSFVTSEFQSFHAFSMVERRVMYPAGYSRGVLFGKGASNIRSLSSRSQASFDPQDDYVIICGTTTAVEAGEAMLQVQFDSYNNAGA